MQERFPSPTLCYINQQEKQEKHVKLLRGFFYKKMKVVWLVLVLVLWHPVREVEKP